MNRTSEPCPSGRWMPGLVALILVAVTACGGERPQDSGTTATTTVAEGAESGEQIYQQRCVSCHQANGQGVAGTFPPLAGSEYATAANSAVPIMIVVNGMQGPVMVHGTQYNGIMPPFGLGIEMPDAQVASVLTYVRTSWGNQASAVTAEDVARVRAMPRAASGSVTAEELKGMM